MVETSPFWVLQEEVAIRADRLEDVDDVSIMRPVPFDCRLATYRQGVLSDTQCSGFQNCEGGSVLEKDMSFGDFCRLLRISGTVRS